MKVSKLAWLAAAAIGMSSGVAQAQQYGTYSGVYQTQYQGQRQATVNQVSCNESGCAAASCDCGEPACGCEAVADPACGCEVACDPGCDSGCDSLGLGLNLNPAGCCDLGDPYELFGEYCGIKVGGWGQIGYHSFDGGRRFNNHADRVNLHQGWLYAEKAIDTSCGFDIGGRVDYIYGVDAQDTQAFGIANNHWDNQWDNGIYGHALPQAYAEVGYGDLSVKIGHFFTLIGYEVVPATGNFFYSHAYTMYNSEPFTHTGFLAKYNASDDLTLYGGYTLGWDSGFEDNGDSFLGGISYQVNDDFNMTYALVAGRFGDGVATAAGGSLDERGYMHSLILNTALTDKTTYIFQTDYLDTEDANGGVARNTFDINQYLLYNISDCWALGTRAEWYNVNTNSQLFNAAPTSGNTDVYALTAGVNYRPHANVLIRPEVRWDWIKEDRASLNAAGLTFNENNDPSQTTFGIDTIITF